MPHDWFETRGWKLIPAVVVAALMLVASTQGANFPLTLAAIIGAIVILAWLVWPVSATASPHWLTGFLAVFGLSALLPASISVVVQGSAMIGGFLAWFAVKPDVRRGNAPVMWALVIVAYWIGLMFLPNIPGLDVGLLGFRRTVLCISGIAAGAAIPELRRAAVERAAISVLAGTMAISIAVHFGAPGLENSLVSRAANEYTGLYGGQPRLQGVFPGPFHVALAGLLLFGWGWVRFRKYRALSTVALVLGGVGLYFSYVRTAYVALALVIFAVVLAAPTVTRVVRQLVVTIMVAGVAIWVVGSISPDVLSIANSLANATSDSRFAGRFPGWREGITLIAQSPIWGWGAGSAGDTLDQYFPNGSAHITPHNIVLKVAVEGGFLGVALWLGLAFALFKLLPRSNPNTAVAAVAVAAMVGLGLDVDSTEALPVSWFALFLIGLSLQGVAVGSGSHLTRQRVRAARLASGRPRPSGPSDARQETGPAASTR